jgi:hypothetical protein
MATELRWIASLPASALWAAQALLYGKQLAAPNIAAALEMPTANFRAAIAECRLDPQRLLPHLIALAAGIPQLHELAEVALAKVLPREQARLQAPRLAETIRQVVAACRTTSPDILDEMSLRAGPIRSQWEAHGPGLFAAVSRCVGPETLVESAEVVLVDPVAGGGGAAYPRYNTVVFEALLADPVPRLPEVVRLAWLVSQLSCDRPDFQEQLFPSSEFKELWTRDRLESLAGMALLPAVLATGEELELTNCDRPTVELALNSWALKNVENSPISAALLFDWWTTYRNSGSKWNVALSALIQMDSENLAGG